MTTNRFGLRFLDRNGNGREKWFATESALTRFLDRGLDSGAVSEVLAFCDEEG